MSLIINQGLCFNYVVSHNIQHSIDESVRENSENIKQYTILFVDVQDLRVVRGNYRNAVGLQTWSLQSMMQNAGIDTSDTTIYYDTDGVNWGSIRTAGIQTFFEFNRTNVNLDTMYQV
ncbi:hypothetical protein [Methanoregula sp. PtaB.Bin085]|uniref:hypothetical protein n=1 Tax=Methanoregula sp. PtaB.Bin085 TaxID=1811680 RepID=UPI0009CA40F3|nr:hypothetical protein [Methanoregula sp. PtaB.Bin085]OPX64622.1 MAG: hypothetical protein A4E33_00800 [Methanoregula sp. PtaB.Bin085]